MPGSYTKCLARSADDSVWPEGQHATSLAHSLFYLMQSKQSILGSMQVAGDTNQTVDWISTQILII
jgi:hypothetical protein